LKRLLLLGGGHAHLQVLRAFAQEPLPSAQATLLTPHPQLTYSGMVPGLISGHYQAAQCGIPLAPLARRAHVTLAHGEACGIDTVARRVRLADGSMLSYDVLSLDIGATIARDAIPGAREHGLFVRPIEAFVPAWQQLAVRASGRGLGVVVIGGGAAGVELALAMAWKLGARAQLSLVTGASMPLPTHPPAVRRHALRALKRHKVTVLEDQCSEITAQQVVLASGTRVACDVPVIALGVSAPDWLRDTGIALDAQGFVATGPLLQSRSHPDVFAAGDVAARSDVPHPRSGVYAVHAGPALALNLRRFLAGGTLEPYHPQRRALNLLACGDRRAIASWGGLSAEGRWVWRWKDRIDRGFVRANGGRV
jgi:pyridine nucleotide-disulfide oxidoreductase family protein